MLTRRNKDNKFGGNAVKEFEKHDLYDPAVAMFFDRESIDLEPVYEEFTKVSELVFGFQATKGEAIK